MKTLNIWPRSRLATAALLMMGFLSACATNDPQQLLNESARVSAQANQVEEALATTRALPDLPTDCRRTERSGVGVGDRQDVALLRTDQALGRANSRVVRCAGWHDTLRAQRAGGDAP